MIVTVPVRSPWAVGVKVTVIAQLPPPATLVPHVFDRAKSPPATTLVILRVLLPILRSVRVSAPLLTPTTCVPKLRLAGTRTTSEAFVEAIFATNPWVAAVAPKDTGKSLEAVAPATTTSPVALTAMLGMCASPSRLFSSALPPRYVEYAALEPSAESSTTKASSPPALKSWTGFTAGKSRAPVNPET